MSPRRRSLIESAAEQDRAMFVEHTALVRTARTLREELREITAELERARKMLAIHDAIKHASVTPPTWRIPASSAQHHGVLCLQPSDIHWGAVVRPEEINFINAYNLDIAQQRLRRTFEGAIKLARDYFAGLTYDGLQLFLPGDMHSGEIHAELRETNAVTIADGIMSLAEPMQAGINMLAAEFGKVNIACVVGNHSRRTRKPIAKHRVKDNYDYLTYRILARDFAKNPKVSVTISAAPDLRVQVYDKFYCLTHGDQFRGGSGIAAELSPLLLGVHRKSRRDAASGKPFDVMTMGHFHKTLILPTNGLIVGGSIMGYDEFAFNSNFRPEPPMSAFWVDTPERGIATFISNVHCMKRGEEGW